MTETAYFDACSPIPCILHYPTDYSEGDKCPVIVGLHGGGDNATSFAQVWNMFDSPHFIFGVPRAPYPFLNDGQLAYDWAQWPTGDEDLMERAALASEAWIAECVKSLRNRHKGSPIYLMGFSQGAYMAYRAGIQHHDLLDGLIIFSGPGLYEPLESPFIGTFESTWPSEERLASASFLPVFIAHGRDDTAIGLPLSRRSYEVLVRAEFTVAFHEFNGGHSIADAANGGVLKMLAAWLQK